MSGSENSVPTVLLVGSEMSAIVSAIPIIEKITGQPVVVVGGIAVLSRLSRPYRATSDLDTVHHRQTNQIRQLELLHAAGAVLMGEARVQVETPRGPVLVDVLDVAEEHLDPLPEDPTGRLYLLSHIWASQTATNVRLVTDDISPVMVLVAQPAALVAMKLQSVMDRDATKEGTDLLDIVRLTTDPMTRRAVVDGLSGAGHQLKADCLLHAQRWFQGSVDLTLRKIRAITDGTDTTRDELDLVAELLLSALG